VIAEIADGCHSNEAQMDTEGPILFAKKMGVKYLLAVASEELKLKFGAIQRLSTTLLFDR
jgi:hypothetical protein